MPRHVYLQSEAPDPVLPDDVVLSLVHLHAPHACQVHEVEESGGEARTYFIDTDLVVKVQRPPQLRPLTSLAKEVFILQQICLRPEHQSISVPRVIGHGCTDEGIEYTILTRMPGTALRNAHLDSAVRVQCLMDLGRTLRQVHEMPIDPFLASGIVPGDLSFMDTMTRIAEPLLDRASEVRDLQREWNFPLSIDQIAGRALSSLKPANERSLLHSNPYEEHMFVDEARGAFTGLIDFGDSYISHPALDLRRWNRPADRAAILNGYQELGQVSDDWMSVWRALMIVADVNIMVRSPECADEARDDLSMLVADL